MLSRRTFLHGGLAASATLSLPGPLLAAAPPMAIDGSAAAIKTLAAQAINILQSSGSKIEAREAQFCELLSAS
ncbi:MAG: twin-arginine translocation signal domain-containing protein, partial [Alphaproteobacteria bacterium]|nr:twin-arginine translocation signal domain-containing protein [Alphaproteobacteria bacterium]